MKISTFLGMSSLRGAVASRQAPRFGELSGLSDPDLRSTAQVKAAMLVVGQITRIWRRDGAYLFQVRVSGADQQRYGLCPNYTFGTDKESAGRLEHHDKLLLKVIQKRKLGGSSPYVPVVSVVQDMFDPGPMDRESLILSTLALKA